MLALNLERVALKNGVAVSTEPIGVPRAFVPILSRRVDPVDGGTAPLDKRVDGLVLRLTYFVTGLTN